MNHIHRHIVPPPEGKDSSIKFASFLTVLGLLILIAGANVFKSAQTTSIVQVAQVSQQQKTIFINKLRQLVTKANRKIKYQQALLDKLNQRLASQSFHSNSDIKKLRRLYHEYRLDVKISAQDYDSSLAQLRVRMLTIDPSIVIAMAALESNWGLSKKAQRYNNYFLKSCSKSRCQATLGGETKSTEGGTRNSTAQIQTIRNQSPQLFNQLSESVDALINTINSHSGFQVLRNTRAGFQRRGKFYTGQQIVGTLKYASIYNDAELQVLEKIIEENSL